MSSIAVFLVLAGGTAFAASQLGKNSVGAQQLKKNAVTAAKLKKNAVTGAKIKPGAVTGAKINEGTLGTVPSAASADVASSLSGYQHKSIRLTPTPVASYEAGVDAAPETVLFSAGPISITAKCFSYSSSIYGMFFIKTSEDGAAFWSEYNYTSASESEFAAAATDGTTLRGGLQIGVKAGTIKGGNQGVFGNGNVCLAAGNMFNL